MAQRLVRRVCPTCRVAETSTAETERELGIPTGTEIFGEGPGCEDCKGTSYRGRSGIHELLPVDDDVRTLVMQRSDAAAIRKLATSRGMRTLRDDGAEKVTEGTTTVAEVLRVTQEDIVT